MAVSIGLGSRFAAFQTSMGRVLLAELTDPQVVDIFGRSSKARQTPYTVQTADALLDSIHAVRAQGWALLDQELELGVRSVAAPVRDASSRAVAAINVSTQVGRISVEEIHRRILPQLLDTANQISHALARQ
jgi:IclR family pca regulon transcriptional regulator